MNDYDTEVDSYVPVYDFDTYNFSLYPFILIILKGKSIDNPYGSAHLIIVVYFQKSEGYLEVIVIGVCNFDQVLK